MTRRHPTCPMRAPRRALRRALPRLLRGGACVLAAVVWGRAAAAQQTLSVKDIQVAATPALSLLGASTTAVEHPNTPRALITSLVSGAGQSGVVPTGASFETAPYWLTPHDALTLTKYYHASLADRIRYFTSFSFATARVAAGQGDTTNTRVALATRTLLANGHPSLALRHVDSALSALEGVANVELNARLDAEGRVAAVLENARKVDSQLATAADIEPRLAGLRDSIQVSRDSLAVANAALDTLVALDVRDAAARRAATGRVRAALERQSQLRDRVAFVEGVRRQLATEQAAVAEHEKKRGDALAAIPAQAKSFAEEDQRPAGLRFELAVGMRAEFASSLWSRGHNDGIGVWMTPSYRTDGGRFEFVAVGRVLTNVREFDRRDVVDGGAKLLWSIRRLDVGGEYVSRWLVSDASTTRTPTGAQTTIAYSRTDRWSANATYPVTDDLTLAASFGSDYRRPAGERPVVATLGLNLGIGALELRQNEKKK